MNLFQNNDDVKEEYIDMLAERHKKNHKQKQKLAKELRAYWNVSKVGETYFVTTGPQATANRFSNN